MGLWAAWVWPQDHSATARTVTVDCRYSPLQHFGSLVAAAGLSTTASGGEAVNGTETRPQTNVWQHNSFWQHNRPSPIADLIGRHRAEMAKIWQRHVVELHKPWDRAA